MLNYFYEIEKFSLYSQTLTPTQIMQTLSSFYGAYNEIIKKYSLVTKIKLIGDDYMSAAGLFNSDEDPVNQAIKKLCFSLEYNQAIEGYN
jgi:hypothetical protein